MAAMPAMAAEPTGEWEVEGGFAHVRIENCGGLMWGAISWEKAPGGIDNKNPDTRLRGRPVLGMPILLAMKPVRDRWEGDIYNSEDGRTYSANIRLSNPDTLRLEGCVLSVFCGSQNWTKVPPARPAADARPGTAARQSDGRAARPNTPPVSGPANVATQSSQEFCSTVSNLPGPAH
jgi:uncharacterized protein (DUF2147 family)